MNVLVGTSGYSFPDWVGPFYPLGTSPRQMLSLYTETFHVLEVNTTYYRIPLPSTLGRMAERTPAGFEFFVKANGEMTHARSRDKALYHDFREAVRPLEEAGKFRGVLAQFPWGFRRTFANRHYLAFLHDALAPMPLFVEFRHESWMRERVFEALAERGIGYCSVDEPELEGLVPPVARVTNRVGYVRLHGRNRANWWGPRGGKGGREVGKDKERGAAGAARGAREGRPRAGGDRYDYDYSKAELAEWTVKIRELADQADKVYVFFNNCHAGHAAKNAMLMQRMLVDGE
jgi:uncharacterized protein YecE (DUF72 family)